MHIVCALQLRKTAHSNVTIDSLNGYQQAMPEENYLILHMHELLQYLNRQGVARFSQWRSTAWWET